MELDKEMEHRRWTCLPSLLTIGGESFSQSDLEWTHQSSVSVRKRVKRTWWFRGAVGRRPTTEYQSVHTILSSRIYCHASFSC